MIELYHSVSENSCGNILHLVLLRALTIRSWKRIYVTSQNIDHVAVAG